MLRGEVAQALHVQIIMQKDSVQMTHMGLDGTRFGHYSIHIVVVCSAKNSFILHYNRFTLAHVSGWQAAFGTFADWKNADGVDASQACCVCGTRPVVFNFVCKFSFFGLCMPVMWIILVFVVIENKYHD